MIIYLYSSDYDDSPAMNVSTFLNGGSSGRFQDCKSLEPLPRGSDD